MSPLKILHSKRQFSNFLRGLEIKVIEKRLLFPMETEKVSNHLEQKNTQSKGLILAVHIIIVKRYNIL